MAVISPTHHPLVFAFGILGNLVSFVVFLAPVPTFVRIYKKKSTEGFQCIPYLIALFSATLWLYYALLKKDPILLISNAVGCIIESIYIVIFIVYASKLDKVSTLKIFLLMNFGGYCSILLCSHFLAKGPLRVEILGWTCTALSVCVFAAPLSIMRVVIKTKSVEFMPIHLSFFLALSAVTWLFYGLLLKDLYVTLPNILGVILGVLQMVLYLIYKRCKTVPVDPNPVVVERVINVEITTTETQKPAAASPNPRSDCGNCQKAAYNCGHENIVTASTNQGQCNIITCEV